MRKLILLIKRRWLPLLVLAALVALPTGDCLFRDRWVVDEGPANAGFAGLPGNIVASFKAQSESTHYGESKRWRFHSGEVSLIESQNYTSEQLSKRMSDDWEKHWKARNPDWNLNLGFMFSVSPDGKLVASGAYNQREWSSRMAYKSSAVTYDMPVLLVFDARTTKEIFRLDSKHEWGVRDIAWSANGEFVALLRYEAQRGFCLAEALFYFFNKRINIDTFYLDVYNMDGKRVASQKLISRSYWSGGVVWL